MTGPLDTLGLSPATVELLKQVRDNEPTQRTDEFTRLNENLFYTRACTSLSDEDATARANLVPSGTRVGWILCTEEGQAPVPCEDRPDTHRHLMWEC